VTPRATEAELRELIELMATIINHDLRNPLSAITTAAYLIESRAESERVTRPLGRIVISAERIDRMISQLVDIARLSLGTGMRVEREPLDLGVVARTVVNELPPEQRARVEITGRGDGAGLWDRHRLPEVVRHLVNNACEHGDEDTTITVIVDGDFEDEVELEIHNHGHIPPERLANLFTPLDASTRRRHRRELHGSTGLGLGLYLSQQIARAHGGTLAVSSSAADGTRFSLALPRLARP
jgi:phosphoserine phosphatase RsbU/P